MSEPAPGRTGAATAVIGADARDTAGHDETRSPNGANQEFPGGRGELTSHLS